MSDGAAPRGHSGSPQGRVTLRVVLADDNFLVRQGTAALLAEVDGVEVVDVAEEPVGPAWPADRRTCTGRRAHRPAERSPAS